MGTPQNFLFIHASGMQEKTAFAEYEDAANLQPDSKGKERPE